MRILTTLLFAFCACALFAVPQITLNQAYLPDADFVVAVDATGLAQDHFLVKFCKKFNLEAMRKAGIENAELNSNDLFSCTKSVATFKVDNLKPDKDIDLSKDFSMAFVALYQKPVGDLIRKQLDDTKKLLASTDDDVKVVVKEGTESGLKYFDMTVADDDDNTLPLRIVLSGDGKSVFTGTKNVANAQIKSAGAIPASIAEIEKVLVANSSFYCGFPISAKVRNAAKELFDDTTGAYDAELAKIKFVGLSALCKDPANVVLKSVIGTVSKDAANEMGVQIQGMLPMVQMMAGDDPSMAWLKTLGMTIEGSNIFVSASISEEQFNALVKELIDVVPMPANE